MELDSELGPQRVGRRRLLGAGLGGAALSLLPFLAGRAAASTGTDASTTTAPPKRPTDDDIALLGFAQQLELTARDLYDVALAVEGWSQAQATLVVTIREAHEQFANAISGALGREAPGEPSPELLDQLRADFGGTPADALQAMYDLESAAVATHSDLLAKLQAIDGAALVASIQIAEARHGTALADIAGNTDLASLLVDTEAASLLGNG